MRRLKTGKLDYKDLEETVLSRLGHRRSEVLVHAGVGEDSAVIDFGEEVCIISSDPITGAEKNIGRLAIQISCNDIAANGAEPLGIQVVLLFPAKTGKGEISAITEELDQTARKMEIEILGGHTEITDKISTPIISITALGRARKNEYTTSSGGQPGDRLILTKSAGFEGTAIIASDFGELLSQKGLGEELLHNARAFSEEISIIPEARIACRNGATAMHDVTEGGVFGALYEMAEASSCGLEIDANQIPVAEETRAICLALDLDPFSLISSGSLLIAAPNGGEMVDRLRGAGIPAEIIGQLLKNKGERLIREKESKRSLTSPPRDELWRLLDEVG